MIVSRLLVANHHPKSFLLKFYAHVYYILKLDWCGMMDYFQKSTLVPEGSECYSGHDYITNLQPHGY